MLSQHSPFFFPKLLVVQSKLTRNRCCCCQFFIVLYKIYNSAYVSKVSLPDISEIQRSQRLAAAAAPSRTTANTSAGFPPATFPGERANATFVTLARNTDIWEIAKSIRMVEDRFNRKFHYDWVFLNDQPFDDNFKKVTSALVSGKAKYGEIPKKHWSFPDHIDQEKAKQVREDMVCIRQSFRSCTTADGIPRAA